MARHTIVAVALFLSLACQRPERRRAEKLTLYCSTQIKWCQLTKNAFEQDTGIRVSMIRKSSGEMYAQLWAERRNPKGDVWYGGTGDGHLQAAEAGLSEPYRSPGLADLHPWAIDPAQDGQYRTTGIYMGALGFAYNSEWALRVGASPPKTWADLAEPRFAGEVQMANPNSSGTAYTALATFVQLFGEERGFDYLLRLHRNINQYTKSGAAPVKAAGRGETGVGIAFLHDAMTQKVAGFPLELVIPEEGTGFEIGCVSVIKGARHPGPARRFVDWALSTRGQEVAAQVPAFQLPSNKNAAVPKLAPKVHASRLIDFDFRRFSKKKERKRLLTRWAQDVKRR